MIESDAAPGFSSLDWTVEAALEHAMKEAKEKGYRQVIIGLTKPGHPTVHTAAAGLTISEKVRLISFMLNDINAQDLGLVYKNEEGPTS